MTQGDTLLGVQLVAAAGGIHVGQPLHGLRMLAGVDAHRGHRGVREGLCRGRFPRIVLADVLEHLAQGGGGSMKRQLAQEVTARLVDAA